MEQLRDPGWIYGPEEDKLLDEAEWDFDFDPGPDLPEPQAEWDALDMYERNLDRSY